MIRDDRWKYVWNLTDVDELYDLDADPGEKVNRIADPDQRARVAAMRRQLNDDLKAQGDHIVGSEWINRQLLEGKKWLGASYE